jgi:pimeloyl-ACP methyl ester carboxylesterase
VLHPERVEKLAVLNAPYPPVSFRTLLRHPQQLLRSAYMYFFQLPGLPEAVLRNNHWELLVEGMRRSSRPGTFTSQDFDHYRAAWWREGAMTAMLNWYRALFRRPFYLPLSPRLSMPVLLLWGKRDFALGTELAEASIALCEQGELVYYETATHWVQHEKAEDVNERLVKFCFSTG